MLISSEDGQRSYIAIDLKSFYASVECMERGVNPLTTNLVVADASRTEKTICLAVTPSLKSYGIPGRARLFEVVSKLREVNGERRRKTANHELIGSSADAEELAAHPEMEVGYIAAPPRMALYMEYSTRIYQIYLRYVAPEDIHVYSIDEVFIDVTSYLDTYKKTPRELAVSMIRDVLSETGITATAGIGTNLYLAKIAMDIGAKKISADENGVRIAELNEFSYRRQLWNHTPITDFWRVGRGIAKRLAQQGIYTMGDIARCSVGKDTDYYNEDLLYKMLGVNAELLIDHAWGYEPCTIAQIRAYEPENNSVGSGQVLQHPYTCEKAKLVTKEMTDMLVLDLVDKGLLTDQLILTIGYDIENLTDPVRKKAYKGPIDTDRYGRSVPKPAQGNIHLERPSSSTRLIMDAMMELFDRIADPNLLVRRLNIAANHVTKGTEQIQSKEFEQMDLFTDYSEMDSQRALEQEKLEKEQHLQQAMLSIKKRYGKNAILRGMNLEEGATAVSRNGQIGGHKA